MRNGKAPALFRQAFRPRLLAMIAAERAEIAKSEHAARERLTELQGALAWLDGADAGRDCKIEARQRGGRWRLVLLVGLLGYSAASPLITIEEI